MFVDILKVDDLWHKQLYLSDIVYGEFSFYVCLDCTLDSLESCG